MEFTVAQPCRLVSSSWRDVSKEADLGLLPALRILLGTFWSPLSVTSLKSL